MENRVYKLLPDGHPETGMQPSEFAPEASFTSDDHREVNHTFFATPDESILSGVWECAPNREEFEAYPVHEMMTVLSGSVTMTDADGTKQTLKAGDTFFIPKGTKCTWEITETLKKYYMIAA